MKTAIKSVLDKEPTKGDFLEFLNNSSKRNYSFYYVSNEKDVDLTFKIESKLKITNSGIIGYTADRSEVYINLLKAVSFKINEDAGIASVKIKSGTWYIEW